MTVSASYTELRFIADGTNKNFTYSWEITRAADLAVWVDGVRKTLTTHYTVTGVGVETGGEVRFLTAPANDAQITIVRDMPLTRLADLQEGAGYRTTVQNTEFDQPYLGLQQINAKADRSIRVAPFAFEDESLEIIVPAGDRANKALIFDDTGNITVSPDDYTDAAENAATALAAAAEATAAADTAVAAAGQAQSSESAAADSASDAAASQLLATSAAAVAVAAQDVVEGHALDAADSAVAAAASAVAAAGSASSASTSAGTASTQAGNASTSASAALAAQVAAEAALASTLSAYDSFDDRYLGAKTSNPSVDNDGNALLAGALYYNTTVPEMRLYTGSAWVAAYVSGAAYLATANNLSDVPNTSTARTNLGLGSMATQAASSVAITGGTIAGTTLSGITTLPGSGQISSGGAIGIGRTPSSALDMNIPINNGLRITDGTTTGIAYVSGTLTNSFVIGTTSAHPLVFYTNNTSRGYIDSSGNLAYSGGDAHFYGTTVDTTSAAGVHLGVVAGGYSEIQMYNTTGNIIDFATTAAANYQFRILQVPSQLQIHTDAVSNALVIDRANGNVTAAAGIGIGVSPSYPLDVSTTGLIASRIRSSNTTGTATIIGNTTSRDWEVSVAGTASSLPSGSLYFYDRSVGTRMLIDPSGRVGIGSTSAFTSSDNFLRVRTGTNQNFAVRGPINLGSGVSLQSIQDNMASDAPMEIYTGGATLRLSAATTMVSNKLGIGITPLMTFDAKAATDEVFRIRGHISAASGITLNSENDAGTVNQIMELRSSLLYSLNSLILLNGSLSIGSSGTYQAGSIYSDSNWGMIFRAKQASPAIADFSWRNSADTPYLTLTSTRFTFAANIATWFTGSSTWSGNPGSADTAKIEYWGASAAARAIYLTNNSTATRIAVFRSDTSDVAAVLNNGEYTGTASSAKYADLAERYSADQSYEPGTVMVVDRSGISELVPCRDELDESVIGVVSANPGFKMNSEAGTDATHPYIALRGRVRVKVVGRIKLGDCLVPSRVVGHARAATKLERIHSSLAVFAKVIGLPDGEGLAEAVIL